MDNPSRIQGISAAGFESIFHHIVSQHRNETKTALSGGTVSATKNINNPTTVRYSHLYLTPSTAAKCLYNHVMHLLNNLVSDLCLKISVMNI